MKYLTPHRTTFVSEKTSKQRHFYFRILPVYAVTTHRVTLEELAGADKRERMNIFRRYFAASRYNRLLIQQALVRSAQNISFLSKVKVMERAHNKDFIDTVKALKMNGYFEEFLIAVKEEDDALVKIIEAYSRRMNRS
jgi:hypothetical protein